MKMWKTDSYVLLCENLHHPLSISTKLRTVVDNSTMIPNIESTISLETKAPTKVLDLMQTSLIRFTLCPVVLFWDQRKPYRSFLCDSDTGSYRMLH